jgi:hypothetical protein
MEKAMDTLKMKKIATSIALPEREFRLLERLARDRGMSKAQVIGHALRVVSALETKVAEGGKVFFEDEAKNKTELVML